MVNLLSCAVIFVSKFVFGQEMLHLESGALVKAMGRGMRPSRPSDKIPWTRFVANPDNLLFYGPYELMTQFVA